MDSTADKDLDSISDEEIDLVSIRDDKLKLLKKAKMLAFEPSVSGERSNQEAIIQLYGEMLDLQSQILNIKREKHELYNHLLEATKFMEAISLDLHVASAFNLPAEEVLDVHLLDPERGVHVDLPNFKHDLDNAKECLEHINLSIQVVLASYFTMIRAPFVQAEQ